MCQEQTEAKAKYHVYSNSKLVFKHIEEDWVKSFVHPSWNSYLVLWSEYIEDVDDALFELYKSGPIFLPFCHKARVWQIDRQTDRQTERILIARPRLHSVQRGKNRTMSCPVSPHLLTGQVAKKPDCPVKKRTPGNPSFSCVTVCWFTPINAHLAVVDYKIISSYVTQPLY